MQNVLCNRDHVCNSVTGGIRYHVGLEKWKDGFPLERGAVTIILLKKHKGVQLKARVTNQKMY